MSVSCWLRLRLNNSTGNRREPVGVRNGGLFFIIHFTSPVSVFDALSRAITVIPAILPLIINLVSS